MDSSSHSRLYHKDRPALAKNLSVDSETWFLLMHGYLRQLFDNKEKEQEIKILRLESLASSLGRNVIERCADDKSGRYRERKDIIRFVAFDIWTYFFGRHVPKVNYKDEGETYFFEDNDFKFLKRIASEDPVSKEYISFCMKFICHLLKSVFKAFSIETLVTGETQNYIDYIFTVQFKMI